MVVFHVFIGFEFVIQFKLEKGETFMLYISTIWSIGFGCQIESFSGEGKKREHHTQEKKCFFFFILL